MNRGRWYPSLVTLADGDVFVASGVTSCSSRCIPPALRSGTNVIQTETFDTQNGIWTDNGPRLAAAVPRLHLLPDGDVFYDTAGSRSIPRQPRWPRTLPRPPPGDEEVAPLWIPASGWCHT